MKKVVVLIAILSCLLLRTRRGSASLLESQCSKSGTAQISSNPWMVRVLVMGDSKCGGSLITSRFVLTAAHCIFNDNMSVRLGESDTIEVDGKWVHLKLGLYQNDIGLLRMAMEVQFSDYIRPICLLYNEETPIKSQFKVTGWGIPENGKMGSILQTTTLYGMDRWKCANKWKMTVDQSQICAGSYATDSHNGDSGGPLSAVIDYHGEFRPILYGIVSIGSAFSKGLGIYTNVTDYITWIKDVITHHLNETQSVPINVITYY